MKVSIQLDSVMYYAAQFDVWFASSSLNMEPQNNKFNCKLKISISFYDIIYSTCNMSFISNLLFFAWFNLKVKQQGMIGIVIFMCWFEPLRNNSLDFLAAQQVMSFQAAW